MTSIPHNPLRRRLKLRDLEVLVALDDMRTVNRAAEALHTSQPAISRSLAHIERMLDMPLFERTPRGVVPTAAGERVIRYARQCLETLDRAAEDLAVIQQGGLGNIAVGTNYSSAAYILPRALLRLAQTAPGIKVSVREGALDTLLDDLLSGRVEVVIARLGRDTHDEALRTQLLVDEPMCLVCGPQHPLANRTIVSWHDLLEYEWILPPRQTPVRERLAELLHAENLPWPKSQVESSSVLLNTTLLRSADVISIVPAAVAAHQTQLQLVHRINFNLPAVFSPLGLIFARDTRPSEAMPTFVRCIEAEARTLAS